MKIKRFEEFTHIILVNASQVAYHEEAHVTYSLLRNFNEVYRYIIKEDGKVLLTEEIAVLKHFMNIQKIRYGTKFDFSLNNIIKDEDVYIEHLSVIDFVDYTLNDIFSRCEGVFNLNISFNTEEAVAVEIKINMDGNCENVSRGLKDRGEIGVQVDDCG